MELLLSYQSVIYFIILITSLFISLMALQLFIMFFSNTISYYLSKYKERDK